MATNYTPLTNGQFATATVFNAPLTELDNAIENIVAGSKALTAPDINGGTIDDAAIGATTPDAGTFNQLTLKTTSSTADLVIQSDAAQFRNILFRTGTSRRWRFFVNNVAESGSNAGANFGLARYDDSDTLLGTTLSITRSTGDATFEANLHVTGTLSKGGGTFKIDHPLDERRVLLHSFIEGPRADLIYRGKVQLNNGRAIVNLDLASHLTPGTFEALTRWEAAQVWVQNDGPGWAAVRGQVVRGVLIIEAQDATCSDHVAWLVVAERNDPYYLQSELTDASGQFITEAEKD